MGHDYAIKSVCAVPVAAEPKITIVCLVDIPDTRVYLSDSLPKRRIGWSGSLRSVACSIQECGREIAKITVHDNDIYLRRQHRSHCETSSLALGLQRSTWSEKNSTSALSPQFYEKFSRVLKDYANLL